MRAAKDRITCIFLKNLTVAVNGKKKENDNGVMDNHDFYYLKKAYIYNEQKK